MSESSRKGKTIAKKACDLCRLRKSQCVFDPENTTSCRKCQVDEVPCTFLKARKARGPPSRHLAALRQPTLATPTLASPVTPGSVPQSLPLPIGQISVEHLVPRSVFLQIIDDFIERVYPVVPLIHLPSFRDILAREEYDTDPAIFRFCISLCAVTIASTPRKTHIYACGQYRDASEMVERACHMVLLSRMVTNCAWKDTPSFDSALVSAILALASHYAGCRNPAWAYASEAIHFFRALELYKVEGYANLSVIETEICKRAFWLLYIMQIHDRLSFVVPHTGLSHDPLHTDWDFLMPLEVDDEFLTAKSADPTIQSAPFSSQIGRTRPVISGFIALIKVFLCVTDVISTALPGPPPAYILSPGGFAPPPAPPERPPKLDALFTVMRKLEATLAELPKELQLPRSSSARPVVQLSETEESTLTAQQFGIMRANVHVTSLYIQSTMLEACLSIPKSNTDHNEASKNASSPPATLSPGSLATVADGHHVAGVRSPGETRTIEPSVRAQLYEIRKSLAQELLDVLNSCSLPTLESNGNSLVVKIREIAVTLLETGDEAETLSDGEEENRRYVANFVEILANLDHVPSDLV